VTQGTFGAQAVYSAALIRSCAGRFSLPFASISCFARRLLARLSNRFLSFSLNLVKKSHGRVFNILKKKNWLIFRIV
jgi:hypothetical protein